MKLNERATNVGLKNAAPVIKLPTIDISDPARPIMVSIEPKNEMSCISLVSEDS